MERKFKIDDPSHRFGFSKPLQAFPTGQLGLSRPSSQARPPRPVQAGCQATGYSGSRQAARSTILPLFAVLAHFHAIRPDPQIQDPIAIYGTCALTFYTSRSSDPADSAAPHADSAILMQIWPSSRSFGLPWPQHSPHADSAFCGPSISPHADSAFLTQIRISVALAPVLTQFRRSVAPATVPTQIRPSRCGHADSAFRGPTASYHAVFSMRSRRLGVPWPPHQSSRRFGLLDAVTSHDHISA